MTSRPPMGDIAPADKGSWLGQNWSVTMADCQDWLNSLPQDCLDSIVTSPPYGAGMRWDEDYESVGLDVYSDWTQDWAYAAKKAVKPGGLMVYNLGRRFKNHQMLTYHWEAVMAMKRAGWLFVDEFVWYKPNANPFKGRLATDSHEYVYVLATSYPFYDGSDALRRPYASDTAARYQRNYDDHGVVKGVKKSNSSRKINPLGARGHSVLSHGVGGRRGQKNPHPAPMSYRLAEDLVKLSCAVGGVVADPFVGSATTGIAALVTGRSFHGCDNDERWAKLAHDTLENLKVEDWEPTASSKKAQRRGQRTLEERLRLEET